jgi:zinc transporter 2
MKDTQYENDYILLENKTKEKANYYNAHEDHDHGEGHNILKNEDTLRKLWIVSVLCLIFMTIEVIGGYIANSIAIMSDAAHLLSDFLGFIISIVSIYISRRGATHEMSFGYHRAEVIGALVSVCLIWGLTIWLLYEATLRIIYVHKVDGLIMLITALIGFIFNIVMGLVLAYQGIDHNLHHHHHDHDDKEIEDHYNMPHSTLRRTFSMIKDRRTVDKLPRLKRAMTAYPLDTSTSLRSPRNSEKKLKQRRSSNVEISDERKEHEHDKQGHEEHDEHYQDHEHSMFGEGQNLNLRAALIHVLGDAVQNLGVIIAGIIIFIWPHLSIADAICTYIFSIIVVCTTIRILRDCIAVLMEGSPVDIDVQNLMEELANIKGVVQVHDLHVWSLSLGKLSLSCHLISKTPNISLKKARKHIKNKYKITHATIQVELESDKVEECEHDLHHEIVKK